MNQDDENRLITQRREKLARIREERIPFPNDFRRDSLAQDLHDRYDEVDATSGVKIP